MRPLTRTMWGLTVPAFMLMSGGPAWGNPAEKAALIRVLLTTEARLVAGCDRVGLVSDDAVEDLRKKIVRSGGDTGLLSFDTDDLDKIYAEIYRCQKPAAPAPTAAAAAGAAAGPPGVAPRAVDSEPSSKRLSGNWAGTLSAGLGLGGRRQQYPTTLRVYEEGGQLRWAMDVETSDLGATGTVTASDEGFVLAGTQARSALPISYSLTLKGQTLEGTGLGADNVVHTLSFKKQP
jgi:hypothetical protein